MTTMPIDNQPLNQRRLQFIGISVNKLTLKETRSVTLNIFRKKKILFKSFVKIELSYVLTINMLSTAENCMEE